MFSKTKNEAFDAFHKLAKVIENEMVLTLFHLEVIREVNFKMSLLKDFVKKMEFTTISLPQEHPNRMVLWRGKIDPMKKVQEPFLMKQGYLSTFGLMPYILFTTP